MAYLARMIAPRMPASTHNAITSMASRILRIRLMPLPASSGAAPRRT